MHISVNFLARCYNWLHKDMVLPGKHRVSYVTALFHLLPQLLELFY